MPAIFHITAWHNLGHLVQQKDPVSKYPPSTKMGSVEMSYGLYGFEVLKVLVK
jgi:hypothetical protein